jgi:hypothetical protein
MESRWTPEISKSDFRGQNSMVCGVPYIIGNLLKCKCLKWARIFHLDIWNTSYGQKKGRESNSQFDSRPEKVGNRPDLLSYRQRATYRWKSSWQGLKLCFRPHLNPKSTRKVMGLQSCGSRSWRDFETFTWESRLVQFRNSHLGVPAEKCHLDVGPMERCRVHYKGKVVASPRSGPWWILCVRVAYGSS